MGSIWRESGERVRQSEVVFREKAMTTTCDEYYTASWAMAEGLRIAMGCLRVFSL